MGRLIRVDAELVRHNLAPSRQYARELIVTERMLLDGEAVWKAARQMDPARPLLTVESEREDYTSRGTWRLIGAFGLLGEDGPAVEGVRCLDVGASTDGFTNVLLRREAAHVVAVDVGYGQIAWRLWEDPRVTAVERTNVRTLDPVLVVPAPGLVVGDLLFISLTLVIPALVGAADPRADFLLLVKPQFEMGKEWLGSGGVVRDTSLHAWVMRKVANRAAANDLSVAGAASLPLPRPAGNIEYFLHMWAGAADSPCVNVDAAIEQAVTQGPAGENARSWMAWRIAVVTHRKRGAAAESSAKIIHLLGETGLEAETHSTRKSVAERELILVLGGDGTILHAVELGWPAGVSILGINYGHVGFLLEADPVNAPQAVRQIAERPWGIGSRITIDVTIVCPDGKAKRDWALNEIAIEKDADFRMLEVSIGVDGREISAFKVDTVLFSTITGSTAYNFSGGGPIVWSDVEGMVLTPVVVHVLFTRPLVMGSHS